MKNFEKAGRIALGAMALSLVAFVSEAQVGIGITVPQEKLHIHDGSVLVTTPNLPAENDPFYDPSFPEPVQFLFKWFSDKSAFRSVGERVGTGVLNAQSIGAYSFASGYENFASGVGATAFGLRNSVSGFASFAHGHNTQATGNISFAYGYLTSASGHSSVAIGQQVSTNGKSGSFIFGDNSGSSAKNDASNQMMMRFAGGYKLFSDNNGNIGMQLIAGGNSWSVISDVNKKENFSPVNGEDFLKKIGSMNLTSWNYKGQDPKAFRHYGPMAQDFYAAFGKDAYGTIGNDTTINQADFDGVNLIAIQALVRKMDQLNSDLRAEIASLKAQIAIWEKPSKGKRILVSKR